MKFPRTLALAAVLATARMAAAAAPAEALDQNYLFEVTRHLYRWYLNESDIESAATNKTFAFWVRSVPMKLDEGDNSQFAEIVLPRIGVTLRIKKADYQIPELKEAVRTKNFNIITVERVEPPDAAPADASVVDVDFAGMREHLFKTRSQSVFPDDALTERLRVALRKELKLDPTKHEPGEQIFHLAPLSPVANEVWVFWENKKLLVHFSSDLDLTNADVWEHDNVRVRVSDVLNQTVLTMDEAAGNNSFMTRAQIGRALYNCIVLGKRLAVVNN